MVAHNGDFEISRYSSISLA